MPNDAGRIVPWVDRAVADAALAGLLAPRKTLPPKLFYDEEGCRLFYQITELPEYYLTRAEREPLEQAARYLTTFLPSGCALVEFGASSEAKAMRLLAQCTVDGPLFTHYVPIDVAEPALRVMRQRLAQAHPDLLVHPVVADF